MELLRTEQFTSVTDYSPIARAFYRMDESVMMNSVLCIVRLTQCWLKHNYFMSDHSLARQPLAGKEGLDTLRYSSCASGIQLLRNAYTVWLDN